MPKQEKMEYIIQKSVELGVKKIVPLRLSRCIVKLDSKTESKKIERWNKIAEAAAKQSYRDIIPSVEAVSDISSIIQKASEYDLILVAYEQEKENTLKMELKKIKETMNGNVKIGIIVGPEGGLEDFEVQKLHNSGIRSITLGKRIMRTETVALNVISISMYELEEY